MPIDKDKYEKVLDRTLLLSEEELREFYALAVEDGAALGFAKADLELGLTKSLSLNYDEARHFAKNYQPPSNYFVTFAEESKRELLDIVATGIEEGKSTNAVAKDITVRWNEQKKWKAQQIARTETMRASTAASHQRYVEHKVLKYDWLLGGAPCSLCSSMADGSPYRVGEGPLPIDSTHPSCVCDISPVIQVKLGGF